MYWIDERFSQRLTFETERESGDSRSSFFNSLFTKHYSSDMTRRNIKLGPNFFSVEILQHSCRFLKTTWRFGFSYYGRVTTQNASKRRVFTALFLVNKRSSDISRASKPRKRFRCSERYETPPQAHGGFMSHLGFVDPLRRDVRLLGSFSLHLFLASPSSSQGISLKFGSFSITNAMLGLNETLDAMSLQSCSCLFCPKVG